MSNITAIDSVWVRDRFNLQFNNILSNKAPGIEDYEISMYMNMAQIEIIDEYSAGVDLIEKNRSILNGYIINKTISIDDPLNAIKGSMNGLQYQVFELSNLVWKILLENIKQKESTIEIDVKPVKYDEFNYASKNPFKRPSKSKAWRLDSNNNNTVNSIRDVKIFYKPTSITDYIEKYNHTYIVIPDRFDIESDIIPGAMSTNTFLIEKVINRATELATRDYKNNTLETQIQTNNRSK